MLKERSDKDTITGLLLRRAFSEQLNSILAESERINQNFSLCLLDIDHFKKVNDTYGHLAGDKVLAGFGQLLLRRFRVDDLRGRWGGEEFVLAFRRERKEVIHKAIERVLEEFRDIAFTGDEGEIFHCSFSGGLVTFPEDGSTIFELLQKADQRLYKAKKQGRNQIIFQSPDLEQDLEKLSAH
jgi:diguanylate cyclase (GGDEF)-like protein